MDVAHQIKNFYLLPQGLVLRVWNAIIVVAAYINVIVQPLNAAFGLSPWFAWLIFYIVDFIFVIDFAIRFRVGFHYNGYMVVFPREMGRHYAASWNFRFDVLAIMPLELIVLAVYGHWGDPTAQRMMAMVRLVKLIRAQKVLEYFRKQGRSLHASIGSAFLKFAVLISIILHCFACMWFVIACPNYAFEWTVSKCNPGSWVLRTNVPHDIQSLYMASIYWTVTTMTTTGYGDIVAITDTERAFAIITMTVGIFFYGYVSGTIASKLANLDSRRVHYLQKIEATTKYMHDRGMDPHMQRRVLDYYEYQWFRNQGVDYRNIFDDLPETFRLEVALSLNEKMIQKAPLFRGCSKSFRKLISSAMKLQCYVADEYIIHKNDRPQSVIFIAQGKIDIYLDINAQRPSASLVEGSSLGELHVLLDAPFYFSAKTAVNTDIYVVSKSDLEHAFKLYPEDRERTLQAANAEMKWQMASAAMSTGQSTFSDNINPLLSRDRPPTQKVGLDAMIGSDSHRSSLDSVYSETADWEGREDANLHDGHGTLLELRQLSSLEHSQ